MKDVSVEKKAWPNSPGGAISGPEENEQAPMPGKSGLLGDLASPTL